MKVGLGTASFGTSIAESDAHKLMDLFVSWGGRIIDTANNYAFWAGRGGESETVIGNWLKSRDRASVEIHTKIGAQPTDGSNFDTAEGLSRDAINAAIDASLARLSTSYVDLLYAHIDDPSTPLLETWSALTELVNRGMVRRLGISNYPLHRIHALAQVISQHNLAPISFAQYRHSLIQPDNTADLGVQICFSEAIINALKAINPEVELVAYSPLLDGGFEVGGVLPEAYQTADNQALVAELQTEAEQLHVSPSSLVLKRIADSGIMPLTMSGKAERLKGNLQLLRSY